MKCSAPESLFKSVRGDPQFNAAGRGLDRLKRIYYDSMNGANLPRHLLLKHSQNTSLDLRRIQLVHGRPGFNPLQD
jgi:hypothetical protein